MFFQLISSSLWTQPHYTSTQNKTETAKTFLLYEHYTSFACNLITMEAHKHSSGTGRMWCRCEKEMGYFLPEAKPCCGWTLTKGSEVD